MTEEMKKQIIGDIESGQQFIFLCLKENGNSYLHNAIKRWANVCYASKMIDMYVSDLFSKREETALPVSKKRKK